MVKEVPVWSVFDGHLNYLVEQQKLYLEIVRDCIMATFVLDQSILQSIKQNANR